MLSASRANKNWKITNFVANICIEVILICEVMTLEKK